MHPFYLHLYFINLEYLKFCPDQHSEKPLCDNLRNLETNFHICSMNHNGNVCLISEHQEQNGCEVDCCVVRPSG